VSISLPHTISVWHRNASMYRRSWKTNILPNFFEPVFYLTALGVGVGAYITEMGGTSYVEFLAPGLICVAAMNGASFEVTYNVFVRLSFQKTYDSMLTAPLDTDDILAGEILWALTRVGIYGGAFFIVAMLFGLVPLPTGLLALAVIPLTGFLFAAVGLAFTLHIQNIDMFSFYFTLFLTPLFLFSGVFFPLEERLSGTWLWVAEILPLLHPVRIARGAFAGSFQAIHLWDLAYIFGISVALVSVARRRISSRLMS
jgi:lipooligosaccharide transport system permease protein